MTDERNFEADEELFRGLRAAYRGLPVPDSTATADVATEAVCERLREAYGRLAIPPVSQGALLPRSSSPFRREETRRALPLSMAAAVLAALGAGLWRIGGAPILTEHPGVEPDAGVEIAAVTSDRLELRSGRVRLVLLTNPTGENPVGTTEEPR